MALDDILTDVEKETLKLACKGLGIKEIAEKRMVSHNTIRTNLFHIYQKFGLFNENRFEVRLKAVLMYLKEHKELLDEL